MPPTPPASAAARIDAVPRVRLARRITLTRPLRGARQLIKPPDLFPFQDSARNNTAPCVGHRHMRFRKATGFLALAGGWGENSASTWCNAAARPTDGPPDQHLPADCHVDSLLLPTATVPATAHENYCHCWRHCPCHASISIKQCAANIWDFSKSLGVSSDSGCNPVNLDVAKPRSARLARCALRNFQIRPAGLRQ